MKKKINSKLTNIKFEIYNEKHYDFCFNYCLWIFFSKVRRISIITEFKYFYSLIKNLTNIDWGEKN